MRARLARFRCCGEGVSAHEARVDLERQRLSEAARTMAKDHGSSVKDDKQYEGLRKKG